MILIIDYGLGNLHSVAGAVKKLGHEPVISNDERELRRADKLILPGVGAFGDGMKNIKNLGLDKILRELVLDEKKPILGICLGSQLMANESFEFGHHEGLGWIDASVKKLEVEKGLRVPHVGWNHLCWRQDNLLFDDIPPTALFYFVHSFHVQCRDEQAVIAKCNYGNDFAAAINKDNIFATQFHPEKSQQFGLKLLENFLTKAQDYAEKKVNHRLNV